MAPTAAEDAAFTITITGHANFSRLADRAYVKLAVTHSHYSKQDVAEKVLSTARAIERQLEGIQTKFKTARPHAPQVAGEDTSLPIAHWSKTSLTSTSHMEYSHKSEQERRKYTARIDFDLRFRDFAALGDFTATTSALEYCEVESVDWYLLDSTKKAYETRLRRTAAADALAKAKDYCSVFCPDVEVVRLKPHEFLAEGGRANEQVEAYSRSSRRARPQATAALFAAADEEDGGQEGSLAFAPQECKMELTISVVFLVETAGFAMSLRDDADSMMV